MVVINKPVECITEDDIHVGDVVGVDYSDSLYKVFAVENDQVMTFDDDSSFWIDLAAITAVEKKTKKKDDKKMMDINVILTESQIKELVHNVEILDYVDYMPMMDWNDHMSSTPATEIIDSTGGNYFNTADEYAVLDGSGHWYSSSSLEEILEPHLDDMLQEFIDNTLS